MIKKIKVGILGCTGAVGQKLVSLLGDHPFFEITELAASEKSAGNKYADRCSWRESNLMPEKVKNIIIKSCHEDLDAKILFSGLDASVAGEIESFYASKGYAVVSNSKNHRMDQNVPLVIPEINSAHCELLKQQESYSKNGGFIVTNPNCSTIVLAVAMYPIFKNFGLKKIICTTMQAISGAGYPGVPSMDIMGNVVPYISGEEAKMESEMYKIFGAMGNSQIDPASFKMSASCNRVPVRDGHTVSASFETETKASKEEIIEALKNTYPDLGLNFSPDHVLVYNEDPARPQPLLDVNRGHGMTVTVGRVRECGVLDWKLTAFGHNTIRGAAGAAILNAEYLVKGGFIK